MFPGYGAGETTQRLADRIFTALQGYKWGVHLASFYLPGDFVPHVRVMDTGYQSNEEGRDTCTFSVYSRTTDFIDESSAELAAESILRFLATRGMLRSKVPESVLRFLAEKGMLGWEIPEGSKTKIVKEEELINIHKILIRRRCGKKSVRPRTAHCFLPIMPS